MKKAKIFIKPLILLCAFFCVLIGILLLNTNKGNKLTAHADETSATSSETFSMVDGARLNVQPENAYMLFTVNITQEIYDDLTDPTEVKHVLWWEEYNPDNTYLILYRYDVIKSDAMGYDYEDARYYFHNDPEHSAISAMEFTVDSENNLTVYLKVPMPAEWDREYRYECAWAQCRGIRGSFDYVYEERGRTNSVTRSVSYIANKVLENEVAVDPNKYSEEQVTWFKLLAGITTTEEFFTVNLVYEKLNGYGNIETVTEPYQVRSIFWKNIKMVQSEVENAKGIKHISEFDCIYEDSTFQKIIRCAREYIYWAPATTDGVGKLEVLYEPFTRADFAIRVQDNDVTDNAELYLYHYAGEGDVTYDPILGIGYLTFYYSDIEAKAFSALGWMFEIEEGNVIPSNGTSTISVEKTADMVRLAFKTENEGDLKNVSILINAEIVPDRDISLNINYTKLSYENGVISEEEMTATYPSIKLSKYRKISQWITFAQSEYMQMVSDAVQLDVLNGQPYFIPSNVYGTNVDDDHFVLHVEYEYKALLQVFKEDADPYFISCTKNNASYTYEDLRLAPESDDWRLSSLTTDGTAVTIKLDEAAAQKATVTINFLSSEKRIVPIYATYSDEWNLVIEYMQNYKNTPFVEKKVTKATIKLADYDVNDLTSDDVAEILKTENVEMHKTLVNISKPDKKVNAELTDTSTYTAKVTYGVAALHQIDYNGKITELKVPLTSYTDWCSSFGQDWTILYLNRPGDMFFQYSNEVAREDLYGFFSVAVFEERMVDLNFYFRNTTGDGQIVMFQTEEVKGSKIYEFFGELKDNVLTSTLGHVGMYFCELFDSDNATYHSYFFYLDGSTKNGYISNGGADNAWDTDGALENKVEDIGDWIENNWWKVILWPVVAIGVIVLVIWLLSILKDFLKKLLK